MNFLVERMEHPGARNQNIPNLNDLRCHRRGNESVMAESEEQDQVPPLKPPVRISSKTELKRSMSKPIITVNDKPIEKVVPLRSSSQRNLTSIFRNDLFHSSSSYSFDIREEKGMGSTSSSSSSDDDEYDEGIIEIPMKNMSKRRRESIHREVQVYSSAFGGKFSDFEFSIMATRRPAHKTTTSPQNHLATKQSGMHSSTSTTSKNTRRFSTNTLSESPFRPNSNTNSAHSITSRRNRSLSNNGFINDSNKAQTRRLVNQFLQSSKNSTFSSSKPSSLDPSMVDLSALTNHRVKDINISSQFPDYSNLTFQNLLYQDLDQSHMNSSFLLSTDDSPTTSSTSSSFIHGISNEKIMDSIPSTIAYQNGIDTTRTTPLTSSTQIANNKMLSLKNESSKENNNPHLDALREQDKIDLNGLKSYKKHISSTLKHFENAMKEDLQHIICVDETNLLRTVKTFDQLALEVNESKQQLIDLQKLIGCDYLNSLHADFNETEETAFLYKLKQNVKSSVSDLKRLESKMEVYKTKLARQRETIKRLEHLAKIDNSLVHAKRNTKSVYKYRYIVIDLLILSIFIYFVTLVKHILM